MKDLNTEARSILDASRHGEVLSRVDRDRIKRGVLLRLATLGAATTASGAAIGMSLTAKITVAALAATILGGGAISLWALRDRTATPAIEAKLPSPATLPPPSEPAPTAAPAGQAVTALAPTVAARSEAAKKTSRHTLPANPASGNAPASNASALESELGVLRQARQDLRAGQPHEAYQRLLDYESLHGKGVLAQEREALSAIALCQWRPGPEAQHRASEFLRGAPDSPLADRVRFACEEKRTAEK